MFSPHKIPIAAEFGGNFLPRLVHQPGLLSYTKQEASNGDLLHRSTMKRLESSSVRLCTVASYAAQYINAYRGSPCTALSGMSQVAQYRASQLTWNYGHSTSDKRAALAYYEYGRYIDATEFGDDASNSYWEADSAEAICAGFYGTDPEAMGKRIADLIRNSSGHWSYISSSEYSYIGVGVDYREGSEYGWYCCVMVGSVNYG